MLKCPDQNDWTGVMTPLKCPAPRHRSGPAALAFFQDRLALAHNSGPLRAIHLAVAAVQGESFATTSPPSRSHPSSSTGCMSSLRRLAPSQICCGAQQGAWHRLPYPAAYIKQELRTKGKACLIVLGPVLLSWRCSPEMRHKGHGATSTEA